LALSIGTTADCDQKFVEVHNSILVSVEGLEKALTLTLRNIGAQVLETLVELKLVDLAISVVVENGELLANAADSVGTAGLQVAANLIQDYPIKAVTV
jgi:hypothetical protein